MTKRRTFSREYKLAAVKKVVQQGLAASQVARDLGIRDNMIHNWRKAFQDDGTLMLESAGDESSAAELSRLRAENEQLKMEPDILRKRRPSLPKQAPEPRIHLRVSQCLADQSHVPRSAS